MDKVVRKFLLCKIEQ